MSLVALLRGANLGKKRFSPKAVETALKDLDVVSLGAAGTFVARASVPQAKLRERIASELPFECEIIILTAKEIRDAVAAGEALPTRVGAKRFATAMMKKPTRLVPVSEGGVVVATLAGRVAIGDRRRVDEGGAYPNELIEKAYQTAATTRDWPTWQRIAGSV